ncbi:MAG: cysteine--tRNA ligase [bacterium]|nr:cysteine--tRNA ligase [bacterium]
MQIRLFNTLTKSVDPFTPLNGNEVRMYSCGPTVYDVAHIGNMRSFLCNDLLQRVLRVVGGYDVKWVMNITDIDDKTIRNSAIGSNKWVDAMGVQTDDARENLRLLTLYHERKFFADLNTLNIKRENFAANPRATDFFPQMKELIRDILASGHAYISDGSVYFNVASYSKEHPYGRLFHIDTENFREGVRIDADEYDRESVSDFVLWKGRKGAEPWWDFEVNDARQSGEISNQPGKTVVQPGQTINLPGRPGWHIECSAMAHDLLGLPFDIHTGGVDLRFPHHEDELAQCTAGYHVAEQATFWVHNEFLEVDGRKMSKSLDNFYSLDELVKRGIDPLDVRFAMLATHYRSVYGFTFDGIEALARGRKRIQEAIYELYENATVDDEAAAIADDTTTAMRNSSNANSFDTQAFRNAVGERLADDLHTPTALAAVYSTINNVDIKTLDAPSRASMLDVLRMLNEVFAVWEFTERPIEDEDNWPSEVREMSEHRQSARHRKDWAESDRLRNELNTLGFIVEDLGPNIQRLKRKGK